MKYFALTVVVLVLICAAAAGFGYRMGDEPALHAAASQGDAMAWLRADFHLDDAQFAAIKQLHDGYLGTCEEHCRRIREATRAQRALAQAHGDPAAQAAAAQRVQALRLECETALTRHVRQVAALMPPAEGDRYLSLVLPKIASFDHAAAPDLQLNHAHTH